MLIKDLFVLGKLGERLSSVEFQMFVRVSQDPHLCHAHAYHDHYQYVDHDLGIFDQEQHGGEYDEDDQDYDSVGEDDEKAHNDDMVEDEEDHH